MSKPKRIFRTLGICTLLYLFSYASLSFLGGYRLVESGHYRPITWMAMEDVFVWQPRFGMSYPFDTIGGDHIHRTDFFGTLYFPLICLDQRYVHKSRPLVAIAQDGTRTQHPWPDLALMHPVARRAIRIADTITAKYQPELDAATARKDKKEIARIANAKWNEMQKQLQE